jgi:hypothetical protein
MNIRLLALLLDEDLTQNSGLIIEGADLIQVLSTHFPTLVPKLKELGVQIDKLKMIGRGDKGTAFSDGNLVVKVTEDKNEARASANLMGYTTPGIAHILFVGQFADEIQYQEEGDEEPIETLYYVIVQELVPDINLSAQEREIIELIGEFMLEYNNIIPWHWKTPFSVEIVKRMIYRHGLQKHQKNYQSPIADNIITQILTTLLKLWKQYNVKVLDIQPANIGKDASGNYIMFDLGVSESPKTGIEHVA